MAKNLRYRLPMMLVAGGLAFGGVLAATTPTRMLDAPEPSWRLPTSQRLNVPGEDQAAGAPYFSASTYEVYPAQRWLHGYNEEAVPPASARFADDDDWRMDDVRSDPSRNDRAVDPSYDDTIAVDDGDYGGDDHREARDVSPYDDDVGEAPADDGTQGDVAPA
ncbi:hypothetical protein [Novosphingobium olei]|uniref:hypothetical protein n=1 Tax=Novosphingobium olei TaxID=2728851 RepID=UPI0030936653|nr:hypothetical protein NSDW_13630 [Novosphingobium olei]